ncbi:MAG: hypothetical protein K2Y21_13975 [Phycisphaerales bacterium]|nr:hypothetical protein [Phycisphaerales bacterium]
MITTALTTTVFTPTPLLASALDSLALMRFPAGVIAVCLASSVVALVVARILRLDSVAHKLLVRATPRAELVQQLERLAACAAEGDLRAMRRLADRSEWLLFRRGVEMLAAGTEPPEIARKLEHIGQVLIDRRRRALRRAAALSTAALVFPASIITLFVLGLLGDRTGLEAWLAGAAFVAAMALLVASSAAHWMCDTLDASIACRTLETEALIFSLSAIRGGAGSTEVASLASLVLGLESQDTPLRIAA